MGFYGDNVLPRFIDLMMGTKAFDEIRSRVASNLDGEVLEVGFGSGRNVPHYPADVKRVRAVDPATVGRKLAAGRVGSSAVPVEYVGLDGQNLPLEDESVDHVLVTWTLCTIPDVSAALGEVSRVLRPRGSLHLSSTGGHHVHGWRQWQDRLTPIWGKAFGGCHLNRSISDIVTASGLEMARINEYTMPGPEIFGYMFEGMATKN